ncbi:MAG: hypothetical protein KBG28_31390 [Kofleriaceae bacterium]|jgi:hypothetical protein|nr:hypothetical protein [Kofleriaceae bacterium]
MKRTNKKLALSRQDLHSLSTVGGGARTLPDDFTKTIGCDVTKGWCAPSIACPTVWCETVMGCAG